MDKRCQTCHQLMLPCDGDWMCLGCGRYEYTRLYDSTYTPPSGGFSQWGGSQLGNVPRHKTDILFQEAEGID